MCAPSRQLRGLRDPEAVLVVWVGLTLSDRSGRSRWQQLQALYSLIEAITRDCGKIIYTHAANVTHDPHVTRYKLERGQRQQVKTHMVTAPQKQAQETKKDRQQKVLHIASKPRAAVQSLTPKKWDYGTLNIHNSHQKSEEEGKVFLHSLDINFSEEGERGAWCQLKAAQRRLYSSLPKLILE